MEEIRQLTKEELTQESLLSQFAFQYELKPEEQQERVELGRPEEFWGGFVDGRLAAKLRIIPLQIFLQGQVWAMGGIASVATWPEHRRHGIVGRLLRQALIAMRKNGQSLSFLAPFSFAFYRKFGWETYVDYKQYTIETGGLPRWERPPGSIKRVDRQPVLLNAIYETYGARYNGMLKRDEDWWQKRVFAGASGTDQVIVYENEQGNHQGYLRYRVKDRMMRIDEFVFLDEQARRAIWRFVSDHDSMIDKVTLRAPLDDRLSQLFDNPGFQQEIVPYFMARIVDVKAFMEQYAFMPLEQSFQLFITDEHAPWNKGLHSIRIDASGKAEVRKLDVGTAPMNGAVHIPIQSLTALLMGYQKADFLWETGKISGKKDAVKRLAACIPEGQTYLTDYF